MFHNFGRNALAPIPNTEFHVKRRVACGDCHLDRIQNVILDVCTERVLKQLLEYVVQMVFDVRENDRVRVIFFNLFTLVPKAGAKVGVDLDRNSLVVLHETDIVHKLCVFRNDITHVELLDYSVVRTAFGEASRQGVSEQNMLVCYKPHADSFTQVLVQKRFDLLGQNQMKHLAETL